MSQVSLGRPEFVIGTPPGHPTAKFLYVIFLYRFFFFSPVNCLLQFLVLCEFRVRVVGRTRSKIVERRSISEGTFCLIKMPRHR